MRALFELRRDRLVEGFATPGVRCGTPRGPSTPSADISEWIGRRTPDGPGAHATTPPSPRGCSTRPTWRWCRARPSERRATCGSPTRSASMTSATASRPSTPPSPASPYRLPLAGPWVNGSGERRPRAPAGEDPVGSRVGNGSGSRRPRAPAGGSRVTLSETARAHATLAHRRQEGRAPGGQCRPPVPPPLHSPTPAPRWCTTHAGRDGGRPRISAAPLAHPLRGRDPRGCWRQDAGLARASRQVNEPREETSEARRDVRPATRGDARRREATRGEATRGDATKPKRLRFQGWNGENSKEPRLVRGLGADQLHLPRGFSPGATQPFTPRSPQSTELPYSSQPRGSRPRRGWARGAAEILDVCEPSRLDASCTSGGSGWGNARGAGRGAGTGPPAPAPLAAGARGWR
jgi:hypothetical protein